MQDKKRFVSEVRNHLTDTIIPFWERLEDREYGGFYGYMGYDLQVDKKAVKGCILNSRILWLFSNAYLVLGEEHLLRAAEHAWEFLKEFCVDKKEGGVFWSVTYDGRPEDTTKHTYNQAFAIYALSSFYDASKNQDALKLAEKLYKMIEGKCRDEYGYMEAFDREFRPEENDKLSENGVMAEKTMNTLLHVMEAYTELYRVTGNRDVAECLKKILKQIEGKIFNRRLGRQEVFFDRKWNSLIDLYSYGHDIETAWLTDRTLEILGDEECRNLLGPVTRMITKNIYDRAYKNHSLANEAENGVVDTTRVWWVQAEAVVGFLNGYEKDTGREEYLQAAMDVWKYICEYLVDKRDNSEWFWCVSEDGKPVEKPIVEPWKCPYHNGRMCLEVIRRNAL